MRWKYSDDVTVDVVMIDGVICLTIRGDESNQNIKLTCEQATILTDKLDMLRK